MVLASSANQCGYDFDRFITICILQGALREPPPRLRNANAQERNRTDRDHCLGLCRRCPTIAPCSASVTAPVRQPESATPGLVPRRTRCMNPTRIARTRQCGASLHQRSQPTEQASVSKNRACKWSGQGLLPPGKSDKARSYTPHTLLVRAKALCCWHCIVGSAPWKLSLSCEPPYSSTLEVITPLWSRVLSA